MNDFSLHATEAGEKHYIDRTDAGQRLAMKLRDVKSDNPVVLALPRGGVVLGYEVAKELEAPLGVVLVRKITHPSAPEYAIGAVAEDGPAIYNDAESSTVSREWRIHAELAQRKLIEQRRKKYFENDYEPPEIRGKTVIVVDDGIATGFTMQAALRSLMEKRPKRLIVAAPVASQESVEDIEELADEVVVLDNPKLFRGSVGAHYNQFEQVTDDEVVDILSEAEDFTM